MVSGSLPRCYEPIVSSTVIPFIAFGVWESPVPFVAPPALSMVAGPDLMDARSEAQVA